MQLLLIFLMNHSNLQEQQFGRSSSKYKDFFDRLACAAPAECVYWSCVLGETSHNIMKKFIISWYDEEFDTTLTEMYFGQSEDDAREKAHLNLLEQKKYLPYWATVTEVKEATK